MDRMQKPKRKNSLELDIHGLTAFEAELLIVSFLDRVAQNVSEVIIIHGYRQGNVLKDMVRETLSHPRIASKLPSLNEGQTRLILKQH